MSRLSQRWRTQRNAIRSANCRIQWIIKFLNAYCASWYSEEHSCFSVCSPLSLHLVWMNVVFGRLIVCLFRLASSGAQCTCVLLTSLVHSRDEEVWIPHDRMCLQDWPRDAWFACPRAVRFAILCVAVCACCQHTILPTGPEIKKEDPLNLSI